MGKKSQRKSASSAATKQKSPPLIIITADTLTETPTEDLLDQEREIFIYHEGVTQHEIATEQDQVPKLNAVKNVTGNLWQGKLALSQGKVQEHAEEPAESNREQLRVITTT